MGLKFRPKIHFDHLEGGDEVDPTMERKINMCILLTSVGYGGGVCGQVGRRPGQRVAGESVEGARSGRLGQCVA